MVVWEFPPYYYPGGLNIDSPKPMNKDKDGVRP